MRVLNMVKPVNSQILGLLEPRSRELLEMRRSFHNLLERRKDEGARIRIVCFYETIPMFKSCIVSEESATIDGEANFPIFANHMVCLPYSTQSIPALLTIKRIWLSSLASTTAGIRVSFARCDSLFTRKIWGIFAPVVRGAGEPILVLGPSTFVLSVVNIALIRTCKS